MRTIEKWYTQTEFVDQDTGEVIPEKVFKKNYYITHKTKKSEIHEKYGIIKRITIGKSKNQLTIFD